MNRIEAVLAAAIVFGLAGCVRTAPIYQLDSVPVTASSGKSLSEAQVRTAIVAAGTSLGWRIGDVGPGRLEATLTLREHIAVVEIPYSGSSYAIRYKRSTNLNERDGTIHSNYNGWVQNLERAIRTEIARL
jgi:hypothetical protein